MPIYAHECVSVLLFSLHAMYTFMNVYCVFSGHHLVYGRFLLAFLCWSHNAANKKYTTVIQHVPKTIISYPA